MRRSAPLRVTYIVPDLAIGGAERHAVTLMSQLDPARFAGRIICLGREGGLSSTVAQSVGLRALGRTKRQAVSTLIDLILELRRHRPDVVIVRGYNAELLGRIAALVRRVPRVVVWVHHCDDIEPRGALRRLGDRLLDPITSAYFGVAQAQISFLTGELGLPAAKVRIVHNGVETALFGHPELPEVRAELGIAEDDLVVGILAALRPEKDHETFLEAAALVLRRTPRARFLIVGDGARRSGLEAHARRLGIADRVVFAGFRDDVAAVLAALDVFVLCSYTVECFPMALLEAMASSRPAVCTAVGGVPEMLADGETGYLVPPRDPPALAGRLVDLLEDPSRRATFGRAARTRVEEQFTLDRSVRAAESLLEVVAGRQTPPRPVRLTVLMDETSVGGVEILTQRLFEALDGDLVRPRLVCLRSAGPLAEDFRRAGFEVEVLHRRGRYDPRTLPRLVRSLRRDRTDAVLMAHHHRASLALGRIAASLARVPTTLVAAHDMDLAPLGKRCLPKWTVATLRWTSALVLLAPSQGAYLHDKEGVGVHAWSRTREVIIPNGIPLPPAPSALARDRARAMLGLPQEAFVVGIVARLSEQKAHHVLLKAFAQAFASHPEARLVVIGGGSRAEELTRLSQELGLADRVQFTGIRRDVSALLPAFDVSCLSSVHEAAPISVIESMAAGLPILATDCGALRDMVAHGKEGLLVPVGDVQQFAAALTRLATDRSLRERMGASARRRAERDFGIETTARGYEELLSSLVGRR